MESVYLRFRLKTAHMQQQNSGPRRQVDWKLRPVVQRAKSDSSGARPIQKFVLPRRRVRVPRFRIVRHHSVLAVAYVLEQVFATLISVRFGQQDTQWNSHRESNNTDSYNMFTRRSVHNSMDDAGALRPLNRLRCNA